MKPSYPVFDDPSKTERTSYHEFENKLLRENHVEYKQDFKTVVSKMGVLGQTLNEYAKIRAQTLNFYKRYANKKLEST